MLGRIYGISKVIRMMRGRLMRKEAVPFYVVPI